MEQKLEFSNRLTLFSENNDVMLTSFFLQIRVMLVKNRVAIEWVFFLNWL